MIKIKILKSFNLNQLFLTKINKYILIFNRFKIKKKKF